MTNLATTLDLDRAARLLAQAAIGHTIDYHPIVESTMHIAQRLAERPDIRSGAVVVADEQSAGRGRLTRRWEAPPAKALLVSIVLKHGQLPTDPGQLPMLAGLAVVDAVRKVARLDENEWRIGLKWPNDVLLGRSLPEARKLAGILIESTMANGRLQTAVVGIGINVNQTLEELPDVAAPAMRPVSLRSALGIPVDRSDLLVALCRSFSDHLMRPAPVLVAEWRRELWTLGRPVTVHAADGSHIHGIAVDTTDSGGIVVQDQDGLSFAVDAGDVSLRDLA